MVNDVGSIEQEIIALRVLIDSGMIPSEKIAGAMQKIAQLERQREKIEGDVEEYLEGSEKELDKFNAEQQALYNSIFNNPEIQDMIQQNIDSVEGTLQNLGFSQEEITQIVENYQADTSRVRANFVILSSETLGYMEEVGIDRQIAESITVENTKIVEECHNEDIDRIAQYFSNVEKDSNDIDKLKDFFKNADISQDNLKEFKDLYLQKQRKLHKEQLQNSVNDLEGNYFRVDLTNRGLSSFKETDVYESLQGFEDKSLEERTDILKEFMSDKQIQAFNYMNEEEQISYIYENALNQHLDEMINSLPKEGEEKLGFFKEGSQLYSEYLAIQLEKREMNIDQFLKSGENLDDNVKQVAENLEAEKSVLQALLEKEGNTIFSSDIQHQPIPQDQIYTSVSPSIVDSRSAESINKQYEEGLEAEKNNAQRA